MSGDLPFRRHVRMTPLHAEVAAESRTNDWLERNGFTLAGCLDTPETEVFARYHRAALADITPRFCYRIAGREAMDCLNRLVTADISVLEEGHFKPVSFCEENGLLVGEGTLARLGASEFRLFTDEDVLSWLQRNAPGFQIHIENVSADSAGIELAGPEAETVLAEAGFTSASLLLAGHAQTLHLQGMPVLALRHIGDVFEFWPEEDDAVPLWRHLIRAGRETGLKAIGERTRELARIDRGRPRLGADYLGALAAVSEEHARTPYELPGEADVDLGKPVFNGRAALRRLAVQSARRRIVALAVDDARDLSFAIVCKGERQVGVCTSVAFMPETGQYLAIATVDAAACAEGGLTVEAEIRRELAVKREKLPVRIRPVSAKN